MNRHDMVSRFMLTNQHGLDAGDGMAHGPMRLKPSADQGALLLDSGVHF